MGLPTLTHQCQNLSLSKLAFFPLRKKRQRKKGKEKRKKDLSQRPCLTSPEEEKEEGRLSSCGVLGWEFKLFSFQHLDQVHTTFQVPDSNGPCEEEQGRGDGRDPFRLSVRKCLTYTSWPVESPPEKQPSASWGQAVWPRAGSSGSGSLHLQGCGSLEGP